MVDGNPLIPRSGSLPVRPDAGGGRPAVPARPAEPVTGRPAPRGMRIPTLKQLASLIVDGVLTLPRNYRRGTYLDILV